MKIKKNRSGSHKSVAIVILVIVFVLAGGAAYWYLDLNGFFKKDQPSQNQNAKDNATDNKSTNSNNNQTTNTDNTDNNSEQPPDNSTEDPGTTNNTAVVPPKNGQLTLVITSKNVANGTLTISADIQQITTGDCTLTIGSYSTTVDIIANPQNSSCARFSVPTNLYSGNNFTISAKADDGKTGSITGVIK